MFIIIERFLTHTRGITGLSTGVRRREIRRLIGDYEDVIRERFGDSDSRERTRAFLVTAKERMIAEVTAKSPTGVPTEISELCQDVIAELCLRLRMLGS